MGDCENLCSLVVCGCLKVTVGKPCGRGFHLGPIGFRWQGNEAIICNRIILRIQKTARFESSFEMRECGHLQLPVDASRTQIFDKLIVFRRKFLRLLEDIGFQGFFLQLSLSI